jgi:DHA2 family multidrug resistance protein-like MFS transporter
MTAAYRGTLGALPDLPPEATAAVRDGLPGAAEVAGGLGGSVGAGVLQVAQDAFVSGLGTTMVVAAAVMLAGALAAVLFMPRRPGAEAVAAAPRLAREGSARAGTPA